MKMINTNDILILSRPEHQSCANPTCSKGQKLDEKLPIHSPSIKEKAIKLLPHPPNSYISVVGPHTHMHTMLQILHIQTEKWVSLTHTQSQHHFNHFHADSFHSKQHMFSFARQISPSSSDNGMPPLPCHFEYRAACHMRIPARFEQLFP